MTKQKQKSLASSANPKPKKIRLPKWWAGLKLEPRWQALWDQLHQETPEQLRKRVMGQVSIIESARQEYNDMEARREAEKQALRAQIADLEDRIHQSRQNSIYGLMNGMASCLEANGRAVHALAEPMQEVLAQLAKDMAQDRQGYVHNSRFDRGKILGYGRGWEKSEALGRQFGMQYAEAPESGIPKHWPQPSTGGQK
jgi:hypothetical protein